MGKPQKRRRTGKKQTRATDGSLTPACSDDSTLTVDSYWREVPHTNGDTPEYVRNDPTARAYRETLLKFMANFPPDIPESGSANCKFS